MKRLALLFVAVALFALGENRAHARLGETLAQIEQRYGQPIGSEGNASRFIMEFSVHGYRILVTFSADETSVIEGFIKRNGRGLNDAEIGAILADNSLKSQWLPLTNYDFKAWRLESNAAEAMYQQGKLTVGTEFNIDRYMNYLRLTSINNNF